jgi:hypothetical protein
VASNGRNGSTPFRGTSPARVSADLTKIGFFMPNPFRQHCISLRFLAVFNSSYYLMAMSKNNFSNNLDRLHAKEQSLRQEALEIIQGQPKLLLHLDAIDVVMTLARLLVDYPKNEEDFTSSRC